MVYDFDYESIEFPISKKDYCKIEQKNKICFSAFCSENNLVYPVHIKDFMSKILTSLCAIRGKSKNKKYFCRFCLKFFSREAVLQEYKKVCLKINDK